MKRLFSIVFLAIFLFNVGGYYLVFWGLRSNAQRELVRQLDKDKYSESDLVELAIPISLPYPNLHSGYERVDGKFEYKGEFYNLVKQKYENDTLFMVCIKNHEEKKLVNAMNEYSDMANSLPSTEKHTVDLFGKLFKDYTMNSFSVIVHGGWSRTLSFVAPFVELQGQSYPVPTPPPNFRG